MQKQRWTSDTLAVALQGQAQCLGLEANTAGHCSLEWAFNGCLSTQVRHKGPFLNVSLSNRALKA